ncbi:MAG: TerB family tellurite resistance protein [Phycisphaerales bacterium]|nr:MAG: TerB family tellurite resistance protein [Phycisphaerales bacterium]
MADTKFIMDLAKLVVAAAWADGELQNEEINALKDLLFNLENVTGRQWAELEIYMDSPVNEQETDRLLSRVLEQVNSEQDKQLVIRTLKNLFEADGVVSSEEQALLDRIEKGLSQAGAPIMARLSKMLRGTLSKRSVKYESAEQRDARIDDYIKNTIYYELRSQSRLKGLQIDLPEQKLRKLCFAGGLLARIAALDEEISEEEKQGIRHVLMTEWDLSGPEAEIVQQVSCERTLRGLDYFRLARGFFESTSLDERKNFLKCLFKIANASNKTSYDEIEEIRKIANSLKLSHRDFIEAKLTIPDEDRQVL